MSDIDSASIETMYSVASQCLHEKKNKRPDIKKVLLFTLTKKGNEVEFVVFSPKCTFKTNYVIWFFLFFLVFIKGSSAAARNDRFVKLYWNKFLTF